MDKTELISKIVEQNGQLLEMLMRDARNQKEKDDQAAINDSVRKIACDAADVATEAQSMAQVAISQNNAIAGDIAKIGEILKNPNQVIAQAYGENIIEMRQKFESLEERLDNVPNEDSIQHMIRDEVPNVDDFITTDDVDYRIDTALRDYPENDSLPDMDEVRHLLENLPDTDAITSTVEQFADFVENHLDEVMMVTDAMKSIESLTDFVTNFAKLQKDVEILTKAMEFAYPAAMIVARTDVEKPTEKPSEIQIGS